MPKLTLFIPAAIWFAIIFYLLVMPASEIPSGHIFDIPNFDKFVHASLFGTLVLLVGLPFFRSKTASPRLFLIITIAAIAYGVAMEFVQKYCTTDRDYDTWDMVADAVGAVTALILLNIVYKRGLRKRASSI